MTQDPNPKNTRQVLTDLVKDSIGVDRGFYFTIHDLYVKPAEVFNSYLNNEGKYLSPFSLLGISLSIYYLISGFLVDWNAVAQSAKYAGKLYDDWLNEMFKNPKGNSGYDVLIVPVVDWFVLLASKYVAALIVVVQVPILAMLTFFTRKQHLKFYQHLVAFSYNNSISLLFLDILIIISMVNIWLIVPFYAGMLVFLPKRSLRIYGEDNAIVGRALLRSFAVFIFFCSVAGMVFGLMEKHSLR